MRAVYGAGHVSERKACTGKGEPQNTQHITEQDVHMVNTQQGYILVMCVMAMLSPMAIASEANVLAEKAKQRSSAIERQQLAQARAAFNARSEQEQKQLHAKPQEWQFEQQEKAQQHFKLQETRESRYLKEAKAAAKSIRKIPKPSTQ